MNLQDHRMLGGKTNCIPWLGLLFFLVTTGELSAQGTGANSKVIEWKSATATGEIYVGILGEIGRPGVYRLGADSLNLQSMIRKSGGMTDEASGTIRIVRQDRIVESLFFTPHANSPVLAGDLLIVESKRIQAAISKQFESDPRLRARFANSESSRNIRESSGVQVAFVNVLDRPVIVKIRHENARLSNVVQMLDQPIELAQSVKVIGPERLIAQGGASQPLDATISDGSVLIFPRSAINRRKLPSLPVPYESDIAAGALPSLIGGPSGQSPELRNVGQLPPLMTYDLRDLSSLGQPPASLGQVTIPTAPPESTPLPSPPPSIEKLEIPAPTQMPVVSAPPRIATIPFTGERRITSSSNQSMTGNEPDLEQHANEKPPEPPVRPTANGASRNQFRAQMALDEELLEDDAPSASDPLRTSSLPLMQMLAVVACVGSLIGLALMTRRYFDRQLGDVPSTNEEIEAALHNLAGFQSESPALTTIPVAKAGAADLIGPATLVQRPGTDAQLTPIPTANVLSPSAPESRTTTGAGVDVAVEAETERKSSTETNAETGAHELAVTDVAAKLAAAVLNPSVSTASKTWFDQLLGNQLPLREEQPTFPANLTLQGRIVSPPVFRVDFPPRPLTQGPHFVNNQSTKQTSNPGTPAIASASNEANERTVEEFDGPHANRPGKPHFLRRRAGENTIAAVAAAARSTKTSPIAMTEVTTSDTPVTDALRHLQGEQT